MVLKVLVVFQANDFQRSMRRVIQEIQVEHNCLDEANVCVLCEIHMKINIIDNFILLF